MKRFLALFLALLFIFTACSKSAENDQQTSQGVESLTSSLETAASKFENTFKNLNDPDLHRYIADSLYLDLLQTLDSDEYFIENVEVKYISKEYLEEVNFNSLQNIYFGFTLREVEDYFQGEKYVFTLGENNRTTVKAFEAYDDTFEKALFDIAIGTGVILIAVTISVATGGAAAVGGAAAATGGASSTAAIHAIFAAGAKTGAVMAASSSVFSGIGAGIVKGIETNDFNQAVKAASGAAASSFKWGAITGVLTGGASKAFSLWRGTSHGLSLNEVATIQKESNYSMDVIKEIRSFDEYKIYREAGLNSKMIGNKLSLVQDIDLNFVDEMGRTNAQRIMQNLSPLDPDGLPYQLHHIGQNNEGTLAVLTRSQHMQGGNNGVLHRLKEVSEVSHGSSWQKTVNTFWKDYLAAYAQ